ncbi:CAT RNA binding domain-containing protein [Salinicoccus sediminis]|nr:CAT RNA binding domain-containing protein [Salinicoccus sediminis]
MKIQKIYNNNIASALNDAGEEVIISGRGIVFGKKKGDFVDYEK